MRRTALIFTGLFPVALLAHSAMYFYLPLFLPILTGALVALLGFTAVGLLLWSTRFKPRRLVLPVLLISLTWAIWILSPNRELGIYVRFWTEYRQYEQAIAQMAEGKIPACIKSHECETDGLTSPYIIFPYPGLLTAWPGILHISDQAAAEPDFDRLKVFAAAAACDSMPFTKQYFICTFY